MRVATRTISGLHDGATTIELDELAIRTAATNIIEEPNYSKLAGRLLATYIHEELRNENIKKFTQSISAGRLVGLINDQTADFVEANATLFNDAIDHDRDKLFEFFGLRTVYDRYLLRHPEDPQGARDPAVLLHALPDLDADPVQLRYRPPADVLVLPARLPRRQPRVDLQALHRRRSPLKHAGGIGLSYSRIRSRGSLIKGTNGLSNGIVPWLKTLDSSVQAVNQGGKRKGAACVYVESWHADIYEFLELRDNTGDESRRTHHLNLANWVPDLFMERVEKDWQ
ncbi:Ribonucleoside-diphosphate reductase large subunit [Nymphon striatum]|nr:Ribonucleoside-diphosphate reductase large subunit [Nymphon striatum]